MIRRRPSRRLGTLGLVALLLSAAPTRGGDPALLPDDVKLARRRSPVVEVFEARRNAVVNIASTQIVQVRSFGPDPLFGQLFDLPQFGHPRQLQRTSVGSGFVIHRDGYVVTNAHVVAQTAERKVVFADHREHDAQLVAIDIDRDLAILKIDTDHPLPAVPLGSSEDLMIGETTIAIGNPLGYEHSLTVGVVSAVNRAIDTGNGARFTGLIQTDASINPGNSGGPLFNINGELIGINTAIRADAQNIGFAIPVDHLRRLLPELLDAERRYRIVTGLVVQEDDGCRVAQVKPDSPAENAGFHVGDHITALADKPIRSAIDYHFALLGREAGQTLTVAVQRPDAGPNPLQLPLTLAERPRPDGAKLLAQHFGIVAKPLSSQDARRLGFRAPAGLAITALDRDAPAARIGLRTGDIIIQIGRHQPTTLDDVGELLETLKPGQTVHLGVLRVDGPFLTRLNANLQAR